MWLLINEQDCRCRYRKEERTMLGWIKLHRKLLENPISKKPEYVWLWIVILMEANHGEERFIFNGVENVCHRGQFLTGRKKLSLITGIKPSTIERILNFLENGQQIRQQKTNKYRLITVINYDSYQDVDSTMDNKRTTSGQQADTNKNDKNEKKDNAIVLSDAILRHRSDIDLILKTLQEKMEIPKLDLSERVNRQYAWSLLRKSKKGVEGVLWLINVAAENEWFRNRITSTRDLWSNQVKIIAQKRGDKNGRVAVL